jgi:uncharacterized protein
VSVALTRHLMEGTNIVILPTTLTAAGIAAIINMWLGIRIGQVRTREKISIGDGGNEALIRRMRAQANFVEFTPFVLILIAGIELAKGPSTWLWIVAGLYMLARVAHAIGMDGNGKARGAGIMITMLTMLGLGIYAIAIPHLAAGEISAPAAGEPAVEAVPQG